MREGFVPIIKFMKIPDFKVSFTFLGDFGCSVDVRFWLQLIQNEISIRKYGIWKEN